MFPLSKAKIVPIVFLSILRIESVITRSTNSEFFSALPLRENAPSFTKQLSITVSFKSTAEGVIYT